MFTFHIVSPSDEVVSLHDVKTQQWFLGIKHQKTIFYLLDQVVCFGHLLLGHHSLEVKVFHMPGRFHMKSDLPVFRSDSAAICYGPDISAQMILNVLKITLRQDLLLISNATFCRFLCKE